MKLVGPKKLSCTVADLVMADPLISNTSPQCLWTDVRPRADRSQQSSLPHYQGTYGVVLNGAPPRVRGGEVALAPNCRVLHGHG